MTAAAITKALKKPETHSLTVTAKTQADLAGISGLPKLEYLTINAKIPVLPDEVFSLAQLKRLTIKGKTLESLDGIGRLAALTELYLRGNALRTLPAELGELRRLAHLELESNKLRELPESLTRCKALEQLSISNNALLELPEWLSKLTALTSLSANKTGLRALPQSISSMKRLTSLSLDNNGGIDVCNLRDLPELSSLSLKNCKLKSLPDHFDTLTGMGWLSLGKNPLGVVPPALASMKALRVIYLWGCKLKTVPAFLGDLPELVLLELESNELTDLPIELGRLTLRELQVDRNRLTVFPEAILKMTTLERLRIYDNQIDALPDAINAMTALEFLRAEGNPFTRMPATMAAMTALKTCYLSGKRDDASWVREQLAELPPNGYVSYNGSELGREGHWYGDPAPQAPSSRELKQIACERYISGMAFAPDGGLVVIGYEGLHRLDLESEARVYTGVEPRGNCVAIAPGGERLLTASLVISLRDIQTGAVIWDSASMTKGIASVDVSPDGSSGLAVDGLGHIRIFSMEDGSTLSSWDAENDGTGGKFSADGKSVLTSGKRALRIWNVADGSFRRFVSDKMRARDARFLRGDRVVSGGFDPAVKIWDTTKKKPKLLQALDLEGSYVRCMEVTPDGTKLLVADSDARMWLFDLDSGETIARWEGAEHHATSVMAITADGTRAVTAGIDKVLRVWSLLP